MAFMSIKLVFSCFILAIVTYHTFAEQVCYGNLGCFSTLPPLNFLPKSPQEIGTQFLFFSRHNRNNPVQINATWTQSDWEHHLSSSRFNARKPTKFLIHGWQSNSQKWPTSMKDVLLNKEDVNIFLVDWRAGAKVMINIASANVFVLATQVSQFIQFLQHRSHDPLNLNDVHMIGHSLGAQTSGNVGSKLGGHIARISGLDPAEPFFTHFSNSHRLDKSDAKFVDITHSDGEPFNGVQGFGLSTALGHADFYPNGGIDQPGCSDNILLGIGSLAGGNEDDSLACSHGRATLYYTESISPSSSCKFTSHPCNDWRTYISGSCTSCPHNKCPTMGYNVDQSARGKFYLSTAMHSPYCGYEYYVEFDLTDHIADEDSFGRFYITLGGSEGISNEAEFSRDNIHYHQRNTEKQVLSVHASVGTLSTIKVRFHHKTGLDALNTDKTVYLHKVLVVDRHTGQSATFCTGDVQLTTDNARSFHVKNGC